ncbi:hypothetical protein STEG23_024644 [Scotinomys teguina]
MRRTASRAHAALLPKLQIAERTRLKGVDPGSRRKERPLRVGCPDPQGTSLESVIKLCWDFDGDCIESVDCFWYVPRIPALFGIFIMKIFQFCGVQVFEV